MSRRKKIIELHIDQNESVHYSIGPNCTGSELLQASVVVENLLMKQMKMTDSKDLHDMQDYLRSQMDNDE